MNHAVKILSGESNSVLRKVPQNFITENAMDITMMKMAIWLLMSQRQKMFD